MKKKKKGRDLRVRETKIWCMKRFMGKKVRTEVEVRFYRNRKEGKRGCGGG